MVATRTGIDRGRSMKDALLNRTRESHDRRDDTGMYKDIFLDIEGLLKWKCKEAVHLIDIIPYLAGDKDPNPRVKVGQWTYVWDGWVHGNVGPNQDQAVCPARTFNQPCPICEYREQLRSQEEYDEELVKSLYPIRRVAYNIVCYDDPKEEAKGVQVWLVSHFFMEKKLMAIAKLPARGGSGGGYVAFADPDEGRTIQFERRGGKGNTEFLGHQFVPREGYTISDETLSQAYQLDQIIHVPTYDELKLSYFGMSGEEAPEPEPEPEPQTRPTRLLTRGKTEAPPEQAPPEQAPPTRHIPPSPRAHQGDPTCPAGGTFGVDTEDLKECGDCELWDDCSTAKGESSSGPSSPPPRATTQRGAPTPSGRPLTPRRTEGAQGGRPRPLLKR